MWFLTWIFYLLIASLLTIDPDWSGIFTENPRTEEALLKETTSLGSSECTANTSVPVFTTDTTEVQNKDLTLQGNTRNPNLVTLTYPQQSATTPGLPAITTSNQTSITNTSSVSDPRLNTAPPGSYSDGTIFRCIVCDLLFENSCCQDTQKVRCCAQCESKLVDGIFKCHDCSYVNSDLSPSQRLEKLIAKINRDKGVSSISNEVTAGSTNHTKGSINNSSVDPAADPVTRTVNPDGGADGDVSVTMANRPIYLDTYEKVWRCRICGWEIEADKVYIFGYCRNGHRVELHRVSEYFTAYEDTVEETEEEMEPDSDEW